MLSLLGESDLKVSGEVVPEERRLLFFFFTPNLIKRDPGCS